MTAAFDRATGDGLGPERLDEAEDLSPYAPADERANDDGPPARGCSLCDGIAVEGGDLCERCLAYQAAREAPCSTGCGQPVGHGSAGRCRACIAQAELDANLAEIRERQAEGERALAESPHRCPCGATVLIAGQRCADCDTRRRAERTRRELHAGWRCELPLRYRDVDLDGPALVARVRDATGIARTLAACMATTDRITLVGPAGVGKTSLAAAAYMQILTLRGRGDGYYVHTRDLALARQQHALGSEAPTVERALEADVAIIDDLGVEGDVRNSAVCDVVYTRHNRCATTIYTTTHTPAQLATMYGDGVARRICEAVEGSVVVTLAPGKGGK